MAAGATYTPIQSYTASGSSSTISFTSIPSTYTDLVIQYTAVNPSTYFVIRFNNDSGSNYSFTQVYGDGSSAASTGGGGTSFFGRATTYGTQQMHVMNYSNSSTYKTTLFAERDPAVVTAEKVCLWSSTSAINQIDFISGGGNITAGGIFTLYGIAAA